MPQLKALCVRLRCFPKLPGRHLPSLPCTSWWCQGLYLKLLPYIMSSFQIESADGKISRGEGSTCCMLQQGVFLRGAVAQHPFVEAFGRISVSADCDAVAHIA